MLHKRLISNLLHFNNLRKFLGNTSVSLAVRSEFKLKILETPPPGKVLVLSPHPDDDVFGCGGTLALHKNNGDQVKIIYLTSAPKRKQEAIYSANALKISEIEFWGLKEGEFSASKRTVQKLADLIIDFSPTSIYCPSFIDPHPDHFETAKILNFALCNPKRPDNLISIFLYEIWSPIYANRLLKIDSVINIKKAAILCHKSQMKERGYLEAILGLNSYRAGMFSVGRYAEAFTALNSKLYIRLFDVFCLNSKSEARNPKQ